MQPPSEQAATWTHRVEPNPNVMLGKPVVQGTRDTGHADTCGVRRRKMEEVNGDGVMAKDVATETVEHWKHLAPALTAPQSEDDHEYLVAVLDEILDAGGADETSPLAGLAERIGELVEAYEAERHPIPDAGPADVLAFLMEQNGLKLEDLPEIGTRSFGSAVLDGKRGLDVRQVAALSKRFGVPADVFIM